MSIYSKLSQYEIPASGIKGPHMIAILSQFYYLNDLRVSGF